MLERTARAAALLISFVAAAPALADRLPVPPPEPLELTYTCPLDYYFDSEPPPASWSFFTAAADPHPYSPGSSGVVAGDLRCGTSEPTSGMLYTDAPVTTPNCAVTGPDQATCSGPGYRDLVVQCPASIEGAISADGADAAVWTDSGRATYKFSSVLVGANRVYCVMVLPPATPLFVSRPQPAGSSCSFDPFPRRFTCTW